MAGRSATHPTFLCGDVAVKFFGCSPFWKRSHAAEIAAHALLATDPEIAAPHLVAHGRISEDGDAPWPYLVTGLVAGEPWWRADLAPARRLRVAAELGAQIRRVHGLRPAGVPTPLDWSPPGILAALERSAFPRRLVPEVEGFLDSLGPSDPVLVHGDLVANHVYVAGGRLAAIIDWGDAVVADRHHELGKLHLETFRGDAALLREFLEAAGWEPGPDFARRALGEALRRQAVGLAQHHAFDLFHRLPELVPLEDVRTIGELADRLFPS